MSNAINELERKIDVTQRISDHPWIAVGVAFGAGIALSATKADVQAAKVTAEATQKTGSKLGLALDGVVAALIAGVTDAFHERVDSAVTQVVTSVRGSPQSRGSQQSRSFGTVDEPSEAPIRAD
jgi:hypothetical protein